MKYLKIISITILLFIIMIFPVNASTLTLPELPGEYEDYIIFDSSSLGGNYSGIIALTFNNLENMYIGTFDEFNNEIYPTNKNPHSNDILFCTSNNLKDNLKIKIYELDGEDWEYIKSNSGSEIYYHGGNATNSINNTDILYSTLDVIDLTDGSVFFLKGSWMKAAMTRPILGMVPYLIGLVIVLVGFWKGLQLLFKTLQRA